MEDKFIVTETIVYTATLDSDGSLVIGKVLEDDVVVLKNGEEEDTEFDIKWN